MVEANVVQPYIRHTESCLRVINGPYHSNSGSHGESHGTIEERLLDVKNYYFI